MPILLNKVERANPLNKTASKKWYATVKTLTQISENVVAKQIAEETTLNPKEAEMSIAQFKKVLINSLLSSSSVQLGDFGSFYLTCNSEGYDTKEEVHAGAVKGLNIRFLPGKELKEAINKAHFVFVEGLMSKHVEPEKAAEKVSKKT